LEHAENEPVIPPPDPFKLQSKITLAESEGTKNRNWLHSSILDKSAFNECIKNLSDNKPPGLVEIVNELLRSGGEASCSNPKHRTHAPHYYVGYRLHTKSLEN
jgi:uridine kinase